MSKITDKQAKQVLEKSDCLYTESEVETALEKIAEALNKDLADKNPIFVCIMTGGSVPFAKLLMMFRSPCEIDYVHATRYQGETAGSKLEWITGPNIDPKDRVVVLIDDIFDEGITLAEIEAKYIELQAKDIKKVVLVCKERQRNIDLKLDYVGLTVPDRYVFGYGMDYKGYLRNVAGIYAEGKE
jgi:hypoxanthine phosphoribosyltransferase